MSEKILSIPLQEKEIRELKVGDVVYLQGVIYTARDMAHLRMRDYLEEGKELPVSLEGAAIFHAGPVVKEKENSYDLVVIGPTTSIRMEPYSQMICEKGVRAIIGKGGMAEGSMKAFAKYGCVYLQAAPGCAVKIAEDVEEIENVYWLELGVPEAMWLLKTPKFGPLVVAMDSHGSSIYQNIKKEALEKIAIKYGE
ncbi:MAG: fumarate hydratase [Clostridia bacterium]|jgi:tartrate/fumarate subfamily iron-sulfur-dependent hydro-lyase beta chain|nr:fumarate hydratase [Clostridia bacterium]